MCAGPGSDRLFSLPYFPCRLCVVVQCWGAQRLGRVDTALCPWKPGSQHWRGQSPSLEFCSGPLRWKRGFKDLIFSLIKDLSLHHWRCLFIFVWGLAEESSKIFPSSSPIKFNKQIVTTLNLYSITYVKFHN